MQVALIPPYNYLAYTGLRPMQMILPKGLKNAHYRNAYKPERMKESFVILDNGMFEEDTMSNENLIELVDRWEVDELVMPDVRGNMIKTIEASSKFLNMFEQVTLDRNISLMVVVQVSHREQVEEFVKRALDMYYLGHGITNQLTFGIPRRLAEALGSGTRLDIVDAITTHAPQLSIHLLGYSRVGSKFEIDHLQNRVRSMDTDAPFVWAHNYTDMAFDCMTTFERPLGYEALNNIDRGLLRANINTLDRWASGRS